MTEDSIVPEEKSEKTPRTLRPAIVAVDGPAGAGKSTICAEVCRRLDWTYVNTGGLYRAVAVVATIENLELTEHSAAVRCTELLLEHIQWDTEARRIFYRTHDLTPELESAVAARGASLVARNADVRNLLLHTQRSLAQLAPHGALVEGRDIGTVVFPDADLKVFLTASLEHRARRRVQQLSERADGSATPNFSQVQEDIARRDEQDSRRGTAPMKRAIDAVEVDTSYRTVDQVVSTFLELIAQRLPRSVDGKR